MTIEKALQSPQVSIAVKELGEVYINALFTKAIDELTAMTNTSMSADAKVMIAESIMCDYWYMRIDEILYVLHKGLKGGFGFSNKNINASVIFEWFQKHDVDRDEHFLNQHEMIKHGGENPNDRSPDAKLAKDVFEEMVDSRVDFRIKKYKEGMKQKNNWTDKDTDNSSNELT